MILDEEGEGEGRKYENNRNEELRERRKVVHTREKTKEVRRARGERMVYLFDCRDQGFELMNFHDCTCHDDG